MPQQLDGRGRRSRTARASREPPPPPEPICPDHHCYPPGSKVFVLRSDGTTYSAATVLSSFDSVFEVLYQVQLDATGLHKQAVPESEMFSRSNADDENFAAHFTAAMQAMLEQEAMDSYFGMEGCDD